MKTSMAVVGIVVAVIVGLAVGYSWGYARGGAAVTASYAPKIAQVNVLFPVPTDLRSLSGQVTAINGTTLTLKTAPLTQNPFAGSFPLVREVTVTSATKITGVSQQSQAEFQTEQQAFEKKMTGARPTPGMILSMPPMPPTPTDLTLSDISIGNTVTVTADSNIVSSPSFTATAVSR